MKPICIIIITKIKRKLKPTKRTSAKIESKLMHGLCVYYAHVSIACMRLAYTLESTVYMCVYNVHCVQSNQAIILLQCCARVCVCVSVVRFSLSFSSRSVIFFYGLFFQHLVSFILYLYLYLFLFCFSSVYSICLDWFGLVWFCFRIDLILLCESDSSFSVMYFCIWLLANDPKSVDKLAFSYKTS